MKYRWMFVLAFTVVAAGICSSPVQSQGKKGDAAVNRARKQALMLDDLYKTAVVIVTTNYVTESADLAAGDAFQALFKVMKDKGYHEVRLLDASGEPIDDDNIPKDGFEKKAVEAIKKGAANYEQVMVKDGKRYLQYATPVPVVMEKCIMCHDNYKDAPKGAAIGALSYTIPVE
ncbi:MAG: DUF3365 domain-containing protein [Planctomycetaceae bacterium]|nr:DUF3365 domain-containing protein [Planctomycetaceae bacterium]